MEPIKGFEDLYEIHLTGTPDGEPAVWSLRNNKYLKTDKSSGYSRVNLKRKKYLLHRIIGEHFINNPNDLSYIDHINGNTSDNKVTNLRWVSLQQNNWNRHNVKGYYKVKGKNLWRSQIKVDGKHVVVKYFNNEEEAKQSYKELKDNHHSII